MKKNKKILALGMISTAAIPISAIVSCGTKESIRKFNILPTYTGQADQLIALGVHSDYYPLQLNTKEPFDYLINPGKYMTQQSAAFKESFKEKLSNLMPSTKGPSWWNQDAKESDDSRIDNTYWQKQEGNVLLYEHYLLDDDKKVIESSWAPKHKAETSIQTNFRTSRDPYTRIPKGVFYGWDLTDTQVNALASGTALVSEPQNTIYTTALTQNQSGMWLDSGILKSKIAGETVAKATEITQKNAETIKTLRQVRKDFENNDDQESEWAYNDWFFVDFFHRNFLDNTQFQNSRFKEWIIDSAQESPFDSANKTNSDKIKKLFDASTYTESEVKNKIGPSSTAAHHPIYEQQEGEIGAAPMFEGAMRDNQLYLFNVSSQLSNLAKYGTPYGKQHYDALPNKVSSTNSNKSIKDINHLAQSKEEADIVKKWLSENISSNQLIELKQAFSNANDITGELIDRMKAMKEYFKDLGLNGKTFGIMTVAPGHGVSTIQSSSKYSFIYKELGFNQPIPSDLDDLSDGAQEFNDDWNTSGENPLLNDDGELVDSASPKIKNAIGKNAMFNMDDNGWFWNLGELNESNTGLSISSDKLNKFEETFDLGIITARDENYKAEINNNSAIKTQVAKLFKGDTSTNVDKILKDARTNISYDLWNEGLKTPFVLHMMLDQIISKAEAYAKANASTPGIKFPTLQSLKVKSESAKDWGEYFTRTFIG